MLAPRRPVVERQGRKLTPRRLDRQNCRAPGAPAAASSRRRPGIEESTLDTSDDRTATAVADGERPQASADASLAEPAQEMEAAQPWPGQLRLRRIELELLRAQVPLPRVGRILEIGCGNAAGAALLRDR